MFVPFQLIYLINALQLLLQCCLLRLHRQHLLLFDLDRLPRTFLLLLGINCLFDRSLVVPSYFILLAATQLQLPLHLHQLITHILVLLI